MELFYSFEAGGEHIGVSYLRITSRRLLSVTRFLESEGSIYTNRFDLELDDGRVRAIQQGDGPWTNLMDLPDDHYPSSAYPLLLPRVRDTFVYTQVSDSDGSPVAVTRLVKETDDIVEYQNGQVRRRFTMNGDTPTRIDWGGAYSTLRADAGSAQGDSGITLSATDLG
ncbi:MAG: hypothetical protein AAF525_02305 [Pseudomonadota bacterium]